MNVAFRLCLYLCRVSATLNEGTFDRLYTSEMGLCLGHGTGRFQDKRISTKFTGDAVSEVFDFGAIVKISIPA